MPLPPVYPHSGEGISLRHWLLPHLKREYHYLLPIFTAGREYHSDTGCCLTSEYNTTPSCLSSLGGGNITQTLSAASPKERIPLPPAYPHCGEGISLRHWLLPHLRREYHSLLSFVSRGREYHSDTGWCLTSEDNTTQSCLSALGGGNITQTLAAVLPQKTIPLPPAYPHSGREYDSDTGCCLTSGENTTPSCLSSLWQGISLRHWLLPHLRREYHSLLPILTRGDNITQTLAAASPQETIPLPPAYPHCGEGISLRHWLLPHLRRQYHSLLPILTAGREYHSDTGCCLTSGDNTTPSCLSSLWQEISLRHWLLPHLKREYHSLLSILTRGREYHSDTGCCLTSEDNTTPSCLSSLGGGNITQTLAAASPQKTIPLPPVYPHSGEGISLRHWLLPHLRREYHSLLPILTQGREYHSDTCCCLTSGDNKTPSCLSSLGGGNITQTLAAASPQETIPLPPAYPHSGEGISLRHWLLHQFRREYHSLLSIVTQGREYHSDTSCCLTSGDNTTPSCLSSLWLGISLRHWLLPHLRKQYHSLLSILTRGGNITQALAAASPQETIPLPPTYPHSGEGISLRHWLLPQFRREYHSLLSILTRGRKYHSDTGCCLTSEDNTTPSCLSSLGLGNITQTLAAASPQERIPLPPAYPHSGQGISLRHWLLPHLRRQ